MLLFVLTMSTHKLSISIDVALMRFVEDYRRRHGGKTRSVVFGEAVQLLRAREAEQQLEAAYAQSAAHDRLVARDFDAALADGLDDEAW
jgi:metal-responsive CopG/Arc/MetJ family transcriptional regulator